MTHAQMLELVQQRLAQVDDLWSRSSTYAFRLRSAHTQRVYGWARRLSQGLADVDAEALLTAAIFHDVGYAEDSAKHAQASAKVFEAFAMEQGYEAGRLGFISTLIGSHSNKHLLGQPGLPLELVLLMEADLMDESGALSIVWDCMAEGAKGNTDYAQALAHIQAYSAKTMGVNPMVTPRARAIWAEKQALTAAFIRQLGQDLGEADCDTALFLGL